MVHDRHGVVHRRHRNRRKCHRAAAPSSSLSMRRRLFLADDVDGMLTVIMMTVNLAKTNTIPVCHSAMPRWYRRHGRWAFVLRGSCWRQRARCSMRWNGTGETYIVRTWYRSGAGRRACALPGRASLLRAEIHHVGDGIDDIIVIFVHRRTGVQDGGGEMIDVFFINASRRRRVVWR